MEAKTFLILYHPQIKKEQIYHSVRVFLCAYSVVDLLPEL